MAHFHRLLFFIFIFSIVHNYSANPSKISTLMVPLADSNPNSTSLRSGEGSAIGKSAGVRDNNKVARGDEENTDSTVKEDTSKAESTSPSASPTQANPIMRGERLVAPRVTTNHHHRKTVRHGDDRPLDFLERADANTTTTTTMKPMTTPSGADFVRTSLPAIMISLLLSVTTLIFMDD